MLRLTIRNALKLFQQDLSPQFRRPQLQIAKTLTNWPLFGNQRPILGNITSQNAILYPASNLLVPKDQFEVTNRTVTKFSFKKGKRKTVRAVLKRFYRLDWGGWIRTRAGRHKHLWRKSAALKRRLRQHVFVNATQATLLDKMVTKYWKRPKFYVDDPYEPYHQREEFLYTRKKPL